MRVLVTGASGFIGGAVASHLVSKGHDVICTEHLVKVNVNGSKIVRADITLQQETDEAIEGANVVVHCAARMRTEKGEEDLQNTNILGTRNVFDSSLRKGVDKIIHMSSTCVMNEHTDHEMTDEDYPYPDGPLDDYTRSKIEAERIARSYQEKLNVVIFRPGWVWGPGSNETVRLCKALESGLFAIPGSGTNVLHQIYIDNLVHAIELAISQPAEGKFILTDGQNISLEEFVNALAGRLGVHHSFLHIPYGICYRAAWLSETIGRMTNRTLPTRLEIANLGKNHRFNTERVRLLLDYAPRMSLQDGVEETVSWFKRSCQ